MAYSQPIIEGGGTRIGRWLRGRRVRLALWDLTKWTVLVIGAILLAFYMVAGRNMSWDVGRQLSWIAAASQALAILVVIFAFVFKLVAIVAVVIFALVALAYLFSDSRRT